MLRDFKTRDCDENIVKLLNLLKAMELTLLIKYVSNSLNNFNPLVIVV